MVFAGEMALVMSRLEWGPMVGNNCGLYKAT